MPKERPTCGKMVKYKAKMQFQKLAPANQEMYKTVRTENRGITKYFYQIILINGNEVWPSIKEACSDYRILAFMELLSGLIMADIQQYVKHSTRKSLIKIQTSKAEQLSPWGWPARHDSLLFLLFRPDILIFLSNVDNTLWISRSNHTRNQLKIALLFSFPVLEKVVLRKVVGFELNIKHFTAGIRREKRKT